MRAQAVRGSSANTGTATTKVSNDNGIFMHEPRDC